MRNQFEKAEAARYYIQNKIGSEIQLNSAIITGTGLGEVWLELDLLHEIPYADIPHLAKSTVQSHAGCLYICRYKSEYVAVFSGRFHYYEGYSMSEVSFPVRIIKSLGIDRILLTNVAGGLNTNYKPGSIVGVRDHINAQPANSLRGPNDDRFGKRFPDFLEVYDSIQLEFLEVYSEVADIDFHLGTYYALQGPSLETPAEYEFIKRSGADLVGMSTVPEVIVAKQMNMSITVLSVVSNICYPIESLQETTLESVLEVAAEAIPDLNSLIMHWLY